MWILLQANHVISNEAGIRENAGKLQTSTCEEVFVVLWGQERNKETEKSRENGINASSISCHVRMSSGLPCKQLLPRPARLHLDSAPGHLPHYPLPSGFNSHES